MTIIKPKLTERLFVIGITLVSGLLLSVLFSRDTFVQLVDAFARQKPGLWGEPAWYLFLMFAGAALILILLASAVLIAFGRGSRAAYRRHVLFLIGLALIQGLLYSSITPPWQSPDEHAHFEYAALVGQLKRVPTLDDLSPALQQRIVSSMFDYDFWRLIKRQPVDSPPVGFLVQTGITIFPPSSSCS